MKSQAACQMSTFDSACASQDWQWVNWHAILFELEMQMLAGGAAGLPHPAKKGAGLDSVAAGNAQRPFFEVKVAGNPAAAMADRHIRPGWPV